MTKLAQHAMSEVVHVFGNEAGDLDSIVSSLAAAHLLRAMGTPAVAVCTFPRAEFRLRNDAVVAFKRAGWALDATVAPVDVTFADEETAAPSAVALTDHNALNRSNGARVVAIFDHHEDQREHMDASPRVVDTRAGSACSLVVNAMHARGIAVPAELRSLLEVAIIVDTRNGKLGGDVDLRALDVLGSVPASRAAVFDEVWRARHDVSSFSVTDLLRLDYKELVVNGVRAGFAAVFEPMPAFVARGNVPAECMDFLRAKRLTLLVAITAEAKASHGERGLYVCCEPGDADVAAALARGLQRCPQDLSPEFLASPLCQAQHVHAHGFGIRPDLTALPTPTPSSAAFYLRAPITRKTLLPAAAEVLAKVVRRL